MGKLIVKEPGLLTTVQDLGRWGYQQYGVAVAGAMDLFSMEVSNKLLGNPVNTAVLEMTLMGGSFQVTEDISLAITGADMGANVDGKPVPMWQSFVLKAGQVLSFSLAQKGVRTYLSLMGGLDIEPVLGSCSTFLSGKMGGFKGRKLASGDEISFQDPKGAFPSKKLPEKNRPVIVEEASIRVVLGPQEDHFTKESIELFLEEEYILTDQVDRMGYRLTGRAIPHSLGPDIISDGIVFGSVQISGDGQPTIMMADHQTTGGYTKIATVISPDLVTLAQLGPKNKVKFSRISPEEAHEIYRSWRRNLDTIEEDFIDLHKEEENMDKIDVESIGKIMDYFDSSGVGELVFEIDDFHLELRKASPKKNQAEKIKRVTQVENEATHQGDEVAHDNEDGIQVKAPVDGICYRAPGENEAPFIEVGQRVKKGDTLLIIEVMKMMNEIPAPQEGTIKSIHFENEDRVEAGNVVVTME